jgi:phosphoribosylanthranilate isomerase
VKVCGITRLEDAEALEALDVDWLGFNFHPGSKRFIQPEKASQIITRLNRAVAVGVFVNVSPEHIAETARRTGIRAVQLHGAEGWETVERVSLPVIKAIPHSRLEDYGGLKVGWEAHSSRPKYFLVDTQSGSEFGGTGQTFDWNLLQNHVLPAPFFLAGGLGPDNLAEAVKQGKPFAVDLNSKVESAPGVKDVALVKKCLEILRAI